MIDELNSFAAAEIRISVDDLLDKLVASYSNDEGRANRRSSRTEIALAKRAAETAIVRSLREAR